MKKNICLITFSILALINCLLFTPPAKASGIVSDGFLCDASFWQGQMADGNSVVLTDTQKKAFNSSIQQTSSCVVDLKSYPLTKSGTEIKNIIQTSSVFPDDAYDKDGNSLTQEEKAALVQNMALDNLQSSEKLRMGVVIRHSSIRTMPTSEPVFSEPQASMFDMFQETAIDPSEPVIILHTSLDGQYYYIQMYNYSGWIAADDIAATDNRSEWLHYADPQKFLVVTDKSYELHNGAENIFYQMGSRLPLAQDNTVILPQRDAQGNLQEHTVSIAKNDSLSVGYLPYTRNNIIKEAFCYLDEPYGWGGLKNSVDCSSFIANIYRTVGILLPRNADQQETTAGQHFSFTGLDEQSVYKSITQNCRPGDAFFMDGHVMLYLGKVDGVPYIIHALGSYYSDGIKQHVLQVIISDLSLKSSSGADFAAVLTSAESFH